MKILEFLNSHLEDWEEILTQEPYHIKVKRDGEYILLSYSQLNSDFTNPIVRESRGSIFKIIDGQFKCVCMPFYKFANYGESYADTINWREAVVMEKIDGSLIKVWWDEVWHVSTNNTIDAYKAYLGSYPDLSFGDIFSIALGYNPDELLKWLNKDYVYMFELISPLTRVVVPYKEYYLYYLSSRNMKTFEESLYTDEWDIMASFGIRRPIRYPASSLNDCIKLVESFGKDMEGLVVSDNQYHRIKVKSPEYLIAAHAANNGVMGLSTALDLIRREAVDDFRAYCDIHDDYLNDIINTVHKVEEDLEAGWHYISPIVQPLSAKERAAAILRYPNKTVCNYIFKKFAQPDLTPFNYLFHTILNSSLEDIIKRYRSL